MYRFVRQFRCIPRPYPSASSKLRAKTRRARLGEAKERDAIFPRAVCTPKTLVFARGTSEISPLGGSVCPLLRAGLDQAEISQWDVQGVPYDASVVGDDCLGLPGGVIATSQIEQIASQCPETKIVVSGYSEGAMVAHNAVGNLANPGSMYVLSGLLTD